MSGGVGHRDRTPLGYPEEGEAIEPGGVGDGVEVVDPVVEGDARDVPVREPASPLVVADELAAPGQAAEPVRPHRRRPLQVEVAQPVRGLEQGRSGADGGVGDAGAVAGAAEPDDLAVHAARRRRGWRSGPGLVVGAGRGAGGDHGGRGHELVAPSVHGPDQALLAPGVPDGQPSGPEPRREGGLADEPVTPHRVEQLALGHDPVPMLDEVPEQVECPRLHVDRLTASPELRVAIRLQFVVTETHDIPRHTRIVRM